MRETIKGLLEGIDKRLPSYFLVKGGRLEVAPLTDKEYANLISHGYVPIVETQYEQLDKAVIEALNTIVNKLGNRALLLFPIAVSAIISHEARRDGSALNKALYSQTNEAQKEGASKEVKEEKRTRKSKT
ncbi:MAG: hypothetical protein D6735_15745 [Acidobacteria bacterium]|nr:MAG: hypothetical protein D6735_15745 [Acidobacteriota bacterium]